MTRNLFTRLLHRGRRLLRGRRRKAGSPAPSFLRLETLEDRRLLAAGFGGSYLFGRLAPVSIEISIQQPTVVSPSSVSFASSFQSSEQSLFSFLLGSQEGAFFSGINNSGISNSSGLGSDLVTPVNSTANNSLTPVNPTANNSLTPATSGATTVGRATQPQFTTTTNLVPNLLFLGSQANPAPLPSTAPSVGPALTAPVIVPTTIRTSSVVSPSANAGSSPVSVAIPPVLPPSIDVPSGPVDTVPVAPPSQPDPAPSTPTVPTVQLPVLPVVSVSLDNVPKSATLIQMSVVTPAMTPETPPVAPPTLDNTPPSTLPVQTSLAVPPIVPALAVPATADAPLATSEMAIAETAEAEPAKEPTLDFAALLLNANSKTANDVTASQSGSETAAPSSGASDVLFTRLAQDTAQKMTITAKELVTPSNEHWMRYVAPLFMAVGAYIGTRAANRKKTNERRPTLGQVH